jgi:hypothetical protein
MIDVQGGEAQRLQARDLHQHVEEDDRIDAAAQPQRDAPIEQLRAPQGVQNAIDQLIAAARACPLSGRRLP